MLDFIGVSDAQSQSFTIAEIFCISGVLVRGDTHAFSFFDDEIMADHIQSKGISGEKQPVVGIAKLGGRARSPIILAAQTVIYIKDQFIPYNRKSMDFGAYIKK